MSADAAREGARRIHPDPPSDDPRDAEHFDVWGFADSGFSLDGEGQLGFSGARYPISGQVLPDFLPWAREIIDAELEPGDVNASRYPTPLPERRVDPVFEQALRERLGDEGVSDEPAQRMRHGHGHTQEEMWAVKYGRLARVPDLVARPASEEEVRALVELAAAHGVCLIPFGGGTNVSLALACPPDETRPIVSVDTRRMRRVQWIDPDNRTACIEAGANGREIGEVLARHGFTLGHEPDSYEFSTLGGWIATEASGMKKNRYGNIEDLVLSVTAVTPTGTLHREGAPARESVGGDPARWLLGSEGRLGIVTRAVVKLFPLPEVQRHGSVLFKRFEDGFEFLRAVQASGAAPASIRLMDNLQFQFGQALKPRKQGLAALKSRLEKFLVLRVLGFEADQMVACTLLFEGSAGEVEAQRKRVHALAKRHGGMQGGSENGQRGYALTFAIAYIRDFMMRHWVLGESFETAVPWSRCLELVANVKQRLWQEHAKRGLPGKPFVSARVTQLYETGVCVYFYFAVYHKGVDDPSEVYAEMERAAREEILRAGGSLSHHHGVGKLRRHFLPQVLSETALEWRAALERAVDPQNLFGSANGRSDSTKGIPS